ncbi:unnamed protein product [Dracunculus medinensis]|uniref:MFS domain-containing protein n=1 Tax=Dracunculus medinensis TaxID=318479 RepID=A0A158Q6A6_DRAME|nr:unnamed protein product [Dracunculus medinensis]
MATLVLANFFSTIIFSCIAPFYPEEAKLKNMNNFDTGAVFGIFGLITFIVAPLFGRYVTIKFIYYYYYYFLILLSALTSLLFGFITWIPSRQIFLWASLLIRVGQALGDAAFVTSSFAIAAKYFPGRVTTIFGILEAFSGIGFAAGPLFGGTLYELGGFQMPFLILGFILFIISILSYFLVEKLIDETCIENKSIKGILRLPVIWFMIIGVALSSISESFLDSALANHLNSFNLSATFVGFIFFLCDGIYTLTVPLWSFVLNRWDYCNLIIFFGLISEAIAMFTIGPSPFLFFNKNLFIIGISLIIVDVAAGAVCIPAFQNCFEVIRSIF